MYNNIYVLQFDHYFNKYITSFLENPISETRLLRWEKINSYQMECNNYGIDLILSKISQFNINERLYTQNEIY